MDSTVKKAFDKISTAKVFVDDVSTQKTWINILIVVLTVIIVCFVLNLLKSILTPQSTQQPPSNASNQILTQQKHEDEQKQCIVRNDLYPEMRDVMNNKDIILEELVDVIGSGTWSTWGESYNKEALQKVPRFSEMTTAEKIKHLASNKSSIGSNQSWKVFGLILEREPIRDNVLRCSKTYELIKNIPGLINAGFSCLEPHSKTPYHNDQDDRFYRVHIPLIMPNVPVGTIGLDVYDNKGEVTKLSWDKDYFVFDDTCYHQAYNNTDYHRVVLLLDVARRY